MFVRHSIERDFDVPAFSGAECTESYGTRVPLTCDRSHTTLAAASLELYLEVGHHGMYCMTFVAYGSREMGFVLGTARHTKGTGRSGQEKRHAASNLERRLFCSHDWVGYRYISCKTCICSTSPLRVALLQHRKYGRPKLTLLHISAISTLYQIIPK
jgi:hypothetical protein